MRKYRGFTLIEMILSIAIILVLMSVATINLNVKDRIEAKYEIKELATNIKFIKNYAQVNNCKTNIKIDENGYEMSYGKHNKKFKFNKLVNIYDLNTNDIRFTTKGKPSFLGNINSAGTIKINIDNKKFYKITVAPVTGKVKLVEIKK